MEILIRPTDSPRMICIPNGAPLTVFRELWLVKRSVDDLHILFLEMESLFSPSGSTRH